MVEPDRNQNPNLLDEVKRYMKTNSSEEVYAQHIHRLDRPVRGRVLFAKKREVLKNLSEQFAERSVKKFYRALTANAPEQPQGRLEHWHRKEKKKAVLYEYEIQYSEKAILDYTVTPLPDKKFLWEIELHTGKYHQIRAQLAITGCPIIGDELYGSNQPYQKDAIALEAYRLVFHHPVNGLEIDIAKSNFSGLFTSLYTEL
ncbi:MAG: RNA pseudouridine synthase [Cyclobacteriaceae bacterium]|nr:MAG: RNA pseudouridine synthase [Cyclobacteriaceae bacterium]